MDVVQKQKLVILACVFQCTSTPLCHPCSSKPLLCCCQCNSPFNWLAIDSLKYISTKHSAPACPAGEWKSGAKRLFQGGGRRLFWVLSTSKTNWGLKKSTFLFQRRTGAKNLVAPLVSLGRRVDGRHWFPALAVEAQQGGCHHLQQDQEPLKCQKIWFHLNHRLFVRLLQLEREGHVPVPTFSQYLQIFDTGSENDKSASALSSTSPF